MTSTVDIANSALRKIGAGIITSFSQVTPSANFINDRYDECRLELLRGHNWNFAKKRALLGRLSDEPAFEFNYFYQPPDDWVRTVRVHDNDTGKGHIAYQEEGNRIAANSEDVYLLYIADVIDPNLMTPDFREALAFRIAMDGAVSLAASNALFDRMAGSFDNAILKASSTNAFGDRAQPLPRGSWVTSRSRSQSSWPE